MKNLNRISSGNYLILSDREMKNVVAGSDYGNGCVSSSETCSGTCKMLVISPEGSYYIKGFCQFEDIEEPKPTPERIVLCGCVIEGSGL